jgi:outer membrane lipopolysaccharide assembly protein LptE/RlpB
MKFLRGALYFLVVVLLLSSCGYHLAGYGSTLPPHLRAISIPVFKNSSPTSEPNIQKDVTDAVRRAFISDGRLKVVNKRKADLRMDGTLTGYELRAVAFNSADSAEEYVVRLGIQVEAYDRIKKKIIFNQKFTTQWDYRATSSVIDSDVAKHTALQEAYADLADRLVSITIERF